MNTTIRLTKPYRVGVLLALCLVAGLGAVVATAQEAATPTKIGVINVRRLVGDSNAGQQALQQLEALRDSKSAELQTLSDELEGLQTQITEGRLSLAQERLNELNRELEDKSTAYRRKVQDAEQEMQQAQVRRLGAIEQEVLPLIQQIGAEQQFAVILSITDGGVVYAPDQVNITDDVVRRYNAMKAASGGQDTAAATPPADAAAVEPATDSPAEEE